jgi:anti-sigma factor RsiW
VSAADLHLATGALALGALPDDERAEVEAHLATCESCTDELAGFLSTVNMLGAAAAETPPTSLRRSVLAAIAVTPQLPPLIAATPPTTVPRHAADALQPGSPPVSNVVPLRRWYRRPGALVAAAIAAVVIGGGTVVAINQAGDSSQQVALTPEQCVAQAADRQVITPEVGQGTVAYAASCNAVTLDVTGLPDLPSDQAYQLWAVQGQAPRSLGLLEDASQGQPQLVTATTNAGESVVAITAEPAAGSPQPTSQIIWQTTLDA